MRDRFLAAWRTGAQVAIPLLLAVLAHNGLRVPDTAAGWTATALIGLGAGVWAAGTHWLQTRTGSNSWARVARAVGRVLVLGAAALPHYAAPAAPKSPPGAVPPGHVAIRRFHRVRAMDVNGPR